MVIKKPKVGTQIFLLVRKSQIRKYLIPQTKIWKFLGCASPQSQIRKFANFLGDPVRGSQFRKFAKKKAVFLFQIGIGLPLILFFYLRKYILDYDMPCLETALKAKVLSVQE